MPETRNQLMYSDDRKGVHPSDHLKGYGGLIQVDGYAGFARVVTDPAGEAPQLAFCWAHNLESVFMWGSGAADAAWPMISPRRTPDKILSQASLAAMWENVVANSAANRVDRRRIC
jgi:Transposase IS66 family